MVHPTNLLRTDSDIGQTFSAPIGKYLNEVDCGIKLLPCLAERLKLQKLAKLSVFVVVLSLLGCVHGIISTYFNGTSDLWISHYNFPAYIKTWLTVADEIFVGMLALCISYWGNRIHRATWMGALTMLIAVSGATLAIPEIYKPFTGIEITSAISGPTFCNDDSLQQQSNFTILGGNFDEVILAYTIIFQVIFGSLTVSFVSHGLTYIDDHISVKHSPALIGLALAANEFGKQGGIYFAWMPYLLTINGIFVSPIWIVITIITFLIGASMAMFPKVLPNLMLKKSVNSLVSIASGGDPIQDEEFVDGHFKTIWRLLKNKILLLNIMSFVLIQAALINFGFFEKYFNQSKYHVSIEENNSSGYSDPSIIQFTTNLLRHPLVAISLLTCGLLVAKLKLKPKFLVTWNIVSFILVILIFSSTAFLNCTNGIQNEHRHAITIPFCSSRCGCPVGESFQPVCVDGKTYFSPCLAGCQNYTPETAMYHNCSCGSIVTEGSCDEDDCKFILALSQVNDILISGIIATTFIVNVVIILRSVAKSDKATALGLELTLLGLVPFIPVKLMYHYITESFCEIKTEKGCQYFSEYFPLVLSLITIGLEVCAVILSVILLFLIKDINIYGSRVNRDYELDYINNRTNSASDVQGHAEETETGEERSPFIRELNESLQRRQHPPVSRQERIQSYIDEGELVPPLQPPKRKNSAKSEGSKSETSNSIPNLNNNTSLEGINKRPSVGKSETPTRPNSRNSHKRNSKASAESDMSSLYRFADSIEALEENSSQASSRGKLVDIIPEEDGSNPQSTDKLTQRTKDNVTETDF